MKKTIYTTIFLQVLCVVSCTGQAVHQETSSYSAKTDDLQFYWDGYDMRDSSLIVSGAIDRAFAIYAAALRKQDAIEQSGAVAFLLNSLDQDSSGKMQRHILTLADRYLYDPNSSVRNERIYITFAEKALMDYGNWLSEGDRLLLSQRLEMWTTNAVGQAAANFYYNLPSGGIEHLYNLNADRILLLFYHPDCGACDRTIAMLQDSPQIWRLVTDKQLAVVAVYLKGDRKLWQQSLIDMPGEWISGYDARGILLRERLYDLKVKPTLYLLDKYKRVLLRDAKVEEVMEDLSGKV